MKTWPRIKVGIHKHVKELRAALNLKQLRESFRNTQSRNMVPVKEPLQIDSED